MIFSKPEVSKFEVAKDAVKLSSYLPKKEKKVGTTLRFLHDLGIAVWFGGSIFGILALNPSVEVLDDAEERGKMVDEGWARFQPYGALGLGVGLIAHIIMRRRPPRRQTDTYKTASLLKDFFIVGSGVMSVASLALGEYAVDDYTPVESATEPTGDTPEDKKVAQSGLSIASIGQLVCGIGLFVCSAIIKGEREKQ